jgi:hypothetical protein
MKESGVIEKLGMTNLPRIILSTRHYASDTIKRQDRLGDGVARGVLELEANGHRFEVYAVDIKERREFNYFTETSREHSVTVCEKKCLGSHDGHPPWLEILVSDPRIKNYTALNNEPPQGITESQWKA